MLTYVYECTSCQDLIEVRQSIKETPLTLCEKCGQQSLQRVIHAVDFYDKTPRTVGTLAEKNTREQRGLAEKQEHEKPKKTREEPFYGKLPKDKVSILGDAKRVQKYIMEGK